MKHYLLAALLTCGTLEAMSQNNTGIGTTTPAPTSLLDLTSTDKGFLIPRMTGAQRSAISNPANGLLVYQTDSYGVPVTTPGFYVYENPGSGGSWKRIARKDEIPAIPPATWSSTGNDQYNSNSGGVGVGTNGAPHSSAALDVSGTTKGFLFPRMTYTQRIAIGTPATGLMVYQTDAVGLSTSGVYFYDGSIWKRIARADELGGGGGGSTGWTISSDDQYSNLPGNVGIGTSTPTSKFHLVGNMLTESGSITINNPTAILQLQSNGINKGFFQLSGNNVRIGTNSGNTGGQFIVRMNGNTHMVIDSTGDTGIGTDTPERKLHVEGGSIMVSHPGEFFGIPYAPTVNFEITDEDGKKGGLKFVRTGTTLGEITYNEVTGHPNFINFSADGPSRRDLTLNTSSRVGINLNNTDYDPVAQLHIRSATNTDALALHTTYTNENATVQFYNTTNTGSNANEKKAFLELQDGNNLRMGTNSGNTSGDLIIRMNGTDQVMVDQAGKVGIGVTPPIAKLHVQGGDDAEPNPFDGNGYLMLGDPVSTNVIFDNNEILARNGASSATLTVQNDGGAFKVGSASKLLVADNGNVGIGTGSPVSKLDVIGRIRVLQNGEAIALDGISPNIGFYYNGSYKSYISQSGSIFALGVNGGTMQLDGNQIAIGGINSNAGVYKLSVAGKIICEELKVELYNNWPDYVFSDSYALTPLYELKSFIQTHNHLPNIPKATQVATEGIELGEMNRKLLEKVEELTLYVIQLQEQIDLLKASIIK